MTDLEALIAGICPVVLRGDDAAGGPSALDALASDKSGWSGLPDLGARPRNTAEAAAVLRLANSVPFVVVPRGAGTGRVGGAVPERGGVVLDLMDMNRILEIDVREMIARVQPGVRLGHLQQECEAVGLFFPPDPASAKDCSVGGAVATCAGGLRGAKYGTMKHYVLGLEVVLPSGEVIRTGARTRKCVTGYDLTSLFVGSEGTLGVVTEITLRLIPKPDAAATLVAWYDDEAAAARGVAAALEVRAVPRALEFVDRRALSAVAAHFGRPEWKRHALLLVECDGTAASVAGELETIRRALESAGGGHVEIAAGPSDAETLWAARRGVSPAVTAMWPHRFSEDVCVPRRNFLEMLHDLHGIAAAHGLEALGFGHAGDGNIHASVLMQRGDDEERARAHRAVADVFRRALALGGTLSAEHGISISKREFLPLELTAPNIAAQVAIKRALDPNGILNPGKIFPGT
ncbi:MAG: FAD-binding protein [Planctomycetes bacterium]|nr:FAD-binding protein [Planctomycetota bacterium]